MHSTSDSVRTPFYTAHRLISDLTCLRESEQRFISSSTTYQLQICTLSSITPEWIAFQTRGISTPFQQLEWISAWLNTYSGKYKIYPFMLVVRSKQRIELLLPLMLEDSMSASRLLCLGHKSNDYNAPLFADAEALAMTDKDAKAIINDVAKYINADCVYIIKQPTKLVGTKNPFAQVNSRPFTSKTYGLDLSDGWPLVYTQARSGRTRQRERNKLNRLRGGQAVQLRSIEDPTERGQLLEQAITWKSAQLDMAGTRNPFREKHIRAHFRMLLEQADKSYCRLYVLEKNGHPLAICLGLIQSKVFNYYFSAYNPNVPSSTSPGRMMMLKLVQLAARAKLKYFDFSLGDEPYKLELCGEGLPMTVSGFALTAKGYLRLKISWLRLSLKHHVKKSEEAMKVVKSMNQLQLFFRSKK